MTDAVLTLNAGSSSLKFAVFSLGGAAPSRRLVGQVEGIGDAPKLIAHAADGTVLAEREWPDGKNRSHEEFLNELFAIVERLPGFDRLIGVGHRVVHGGVRFTDPVRITPAILAELEGLVPLAPLHEPHNLAPIRAVAATRPDLVQVACFDTAFHHNFPPVAAHFALPRELTKSGIRRFGFHGLSYEYLAGALRTVAPELASGRVVLAHLGSGASLCALLDGRSVDTTMGFTALDGLAMGTRSGAIDPGVILYLLRNRGMSVDEVEALLYKRSGLLGISGISSDMRALIASDDPAAAEAVALFCRRAACGMVAMATALGGLDGIVFAGGIGEHGQEVRRRICDELSWIGVQLDAGRNADGKDQISSAASLVSVWVIPTDEEVVIARHTARVIGVADPEG